MKVDFIASFFELNEAAFTVDVESEEGAVFKVEIGSLDVRRFASGQVSDLKAIPLSLDLEIVIMFASLDAHVDKIVLSLSLCALKLNVLFLLILNVVSCNSEEVLVISGKGVSLVAVWIICGDKCSRVVSRYEGLVS
jgi:hypothetical protein